MEHFNAKGNWWRSIFWRRNAAWRTLVLKFGANFNLSLNLWMKTTDCVKTWVECQTVTKMVSTLIPFVSCSPPAPMGKPKPLWKMFQSLDNPAYNTNLGNWKRLSKLAYYGKEFQSLDNPLITQTIESFMLEVNTSFIRMAFSSTFNTLEDCQICNWRNDTLLHLFILFLRQVDLFIGNDFTHRLFRHHCVDWIFFGIWTD